MAANISHFIATTISTLTCFATALDEWVCAKAFCDELNRSDFKSVSKKTKWSNKIRIVWADIRHIIITIDCVAKSKLKTIELISNVRVWSTMAVGQQMHQQFNWWVLLWNLQLQCGESPLETLDVHVSLSLWHGRTTGMCNRTEQLYSCITVSSKLSRWSMRAPDLRQTSMLASNFFLNYRQSTEME